MSDAEYDLGHVCDLRLSDTLGSESSELYDSFRERVKLGRERLATHPPRARL